MLAGPITPRSEVQILPPLFQYKLLAQKIFIWDTFSKNMIVAGVDEAGRGPLIGPLIMAGVSFKENVLNSLKNLGVKDSKLLTQKKREELYKKIIELAENYKIFIVQPKEIDHFVQSQIFNLNKLEAFYTVKILKILKPDKAYIDCPTHNTKRYKEYLSSLLGKEFLKHTKIIAENKADYRYIACSAASILAKVTREREISKLKKRYGDFGSGYLTDEKTLKFLKKYYKQYAEIFRKSWVTYQEQLVKQKNILEFTNND